MFTELQVALQLLLQLDFFGFFFSFEIFKHFLIKGLSVDASPSVVIEVVLIKNELTLVGLPRCLIVIHFWRRTEFFGIQAD